MIYVGLNQIIRELLRSFEFQPGAANSQRIF